MGQDKTNTYGKMYKKDQGGGASGQKTRCPAPLIFSYVNLQSKPHYSQQTA